MNKTLERPLPAGGLGSVEEGRLLLSRLAGQLVVDADGTTLGTLRDMVVRIDGPANPSLRGLLVEDSESGVFVQAEDLAGLDPPTLRAGATLEAFDRQTGDLLLQRDLLDRWLLDVKHHRAVQASDVVLSTAGAGSRLLALDVSSYGIARRLGPRWLARMLDGEFVAWSDLEVLWAVGPAAGLPRRPGRLADLDPADMARLAEQLSDADAAAVLRTLDEPQAAAVLEEFQDERQGAVLRHLPREYAVHLLRLMRPDAAADVLDDLETPEVDALLTAVDRSQAGFIREALEYPKASASAPVLLFFAMAFAGQTVSAVVASLRAGSGGRRLEDWYMFVVGDKQHPRLVGVVSPDALLAAETNDMLGAIMQPARCQVRPEESARAAAALMAEYNLLVLPVVDGSGEMRGVITADDALDVLISGSASRR